MTAQARLGELRALLARANGRPWIVSGKGIWVETFAGCGGPDPQPPEGEQIGEADDADLIVALVNEAEALIECAEALDRIAASQADLGNCARGAAQVDLRPAEVARHHYECAAVARAALAKLGGSE